MKSTLRLSIVFALASVLSWAQSPNATVAGRVLDPSSAVVSDAKVNIINLYTNIHYTGQTNHEGSFVIPNLPPGPYRIEVSKSGFKTAVREDVVLRVQDVIALNFTLPIGSVTESVTVTGGAPLVNTQDAAVSTVVDRQFAENLPLNGRSFQALIQLTPGVVLVPGSSGYDSGQFSINGQRATSNYWMVDGVSANVGINTFGQPGNGFSGALGSFGVQGGTNSLVSVDALQEFRIQTSTYAPEFGRTPGGQISIVTRSGANQFHGTVFDYLRNDALDANDWFNGYINNPPLLKAEERQNDFGATLGGRILKDRTFFFLSYEGLRLRLPETALTTVPDLAARQNAIPAVQPFLNAFPLPGNGTTDVGSGYAPFNASFSNRSTLDAYSLRIDHVLGNNLNVFGRYDYSPSDLVQRGPSLSGLTDSRITVQTATIGGTWTKSSETSNDVRFNYSRSNAASRNYLDTFGGAVVPPASSQLPTPFTVSDSSFQFGFFIGSGMFYSDGKNAHNLQRQFNVVDSISMQRGRHALKFGVDFRRLSPVSSPRAYVQAAFFSDVPSAETGSSFESVVSSSRSATILFRNLGIYAQDTWRIAPRLTLTYGVRWDVDFAPSSLSGPSLNAVTGYNLNNLSQLALAPAGTPIFNTAYGNVAPRIGGAYQLSQKPNWELVLRGGFGVFYDMMTSEVGNVIAIPTYPFGASAFTFGGTFPLSSAAAASPPITPAELQATGLAAFDPHLNLPYTLEWNVAAEQNLGRQQVISASYVGSAGRRLIQTAVIISPNANIAGADLTTDAGTSDYNAFQLQFQRRLSPSLQVLASYSWSHSIDTASAGSIGNAANTLVPSVNPSLNRGPSDFDTRNTLSGAVTYELPAPKLNAFVTAILRGWSVENIIQARSAQPVNAYNSAFSELPGGFFTNIRPDLVPGIRTYLYGSQYPGRKALNPAAFVNPPTTPPGCNPAVDFPCSPLRQGDLGRNALRGFGATQWDFAVHRVFPIHESLSLQFRAEIFNALNHPNFGQPVGDLSGFNGPFGQSTQMLGRSLNTNAGGGSLSPLYQMGGPRSIQVALKFQF